MQKIHSRQEPYIWYSHIAEKLSMHSSNLALLIKSMWKIVRQFWTMQRAVSVRRAASNFGQSI